MTDEPEWVNVHVGYGGDDFAIDGIRVWQHRWHNTGKELMLEKRPDDSRLDRFLIYEIPADGKVISFAAAEILNSVYSFYRFMVRPDNFRSLKKAMEIQSYLSKKDSSD
jgi:hypothetical protein